MQVNLRVRRFDPEKSGEQGWWQDYEVEIHPSSTILDALIDVLEAHYDCGSLQITPIQREQHVQP